MKIQITEKELMEGVRICKDSEIAAKGIIDEIKFRKMSDAEIMQMIRRTKIAGIGNATFRRFYSESLHDVIYEFTVNPDFVCKIMSASHDAILDVIQLVKDFYNPLKRLCRCYVEKIHNIITNFGEKSAMKKAAKKPVEVRRQMKKPATPKVAESDCCKYNMDIDRYNELRRKIYVFHLVKNGKMRYTKEEICRKLIDDGLKIDKNDHIYINNIYDQFKESLEEVTSRK